MIYCHQAVHSPIRPHVLLVSACAAALFASAPALAQETSPECEADATVASPASDDLHDVIVVTAAGIERLDVVAGTSLLTGMNLQRELDGQIGEVLAKLPGVSATSFAPGASRPILRGFGGERVRVLSDGIGALDASGNSADHAVSVDPLIADRVEVLRGPAVLLYGSQAIGGAVNIITRRIPPRLPEEPLHLDALAGFDTASDLREGGLSLDAPIGGGFAVHADGSWRTTDDLAIPGFAASPTLRADLLADAEEEEEEGHLEEAAELRDAASIANVLPNSATESWSAGAGFAWFSGDSNVGASFDYYDTTYGIPGLPGIGHVHGEEEAEVGPGEEEEEEHGAVPVAIGLKRYRADLRGVLDLGGGLFDEVRTRWGWSDYTHTEFEGNEIGTVFDVQGVEGRVELVQSRRGAWRGSVGGQYSHVDFAAIGEEAYVPANVTDSFALFTLQEVDFDRLELEAGARFEHTAVEADGLGVARAFDTLSGAVGLSYPLVDDFRAGVNLSRAERAPSAQELFADGPHLATQQFEVGNAALGTESAWGVEGYVRGELGRAQVNFSIYRNWFEDFVYLSDTGAEEDGLPVFRYLQQGADHFGLEGQVTFPLIEGRSFYLLGEVGGEYVRATLADGSAVPRIPPLGLLGALEAQFDHFDLRGEVEWTAAQERTAPFESTTDGFAFVNMSVAWHPFEGSDNFTVIAQVDNLFDTEGRRHASFTKEFVPLAGRNFKVTARASF